MVKSSKSDQLYLQLRRRISAMKDGEPFPTVRQLMTEYQVSQSTVTPAINQLKEKGLIEAYVGRGSFVSKKDAGKPHMLLLQHNWPAPILPFMAERLRRAAEEDGFRFEHRIYDYHDDITLTLSNYEADIIVVDGIADDLMTPEQILAISRCPAPVILSRNSVPISQINYVCGDNAAAGVNISSRCKSGPGASAGSIGWGVCCGPGVKTASSSVTSSMRHSLNTRSACRARQYACRYQAASL